MERYRTASEVRGRPARANDRDQAPKPRRPRAPSQVAQTLARALQRDLFTGPDDLVFPNEVGRWLDGSALRRRYKDAQKRAQLRPLRLHDLRHTFGTHGRASAESDRELQEWMGHADARTTARRASSVSYSYRSSSKLRDGRMSRRPRGRCLPHRRASTSGAARASWAASRRAASSNCSAQISGSSTALRHSSASPRELTPRRRRAFFTCVRTVCTESTSSSAIWRVPSPSA